MHGTGFHLYEEMVAGELWLEIRGTDLAFEATPNSVAIRLPKDFIKAMKWEQPKPWNPTQADLKRAVRILGKRPSPGKRKVNAEKASMQLPEPAESIKRKTKHER